MRKYLESHPWMRFEADLSRSSSEIWILLGEAASKIEHLGQSPLKPGLAAELMQVALIKGAVATTAIEGNTLTEDQVRRILDGELKLPPSQAYLAKEVENVILSCNQLEEELKAGFIPSLTIDRIKQWNFQLLNGLQLDPEIIPGEIRKHSVTVGRYLGAPAEDCEFLLNELCTWLPTLIESGKDNINLKMPFAIIQAVLAHLYMAWIHPFGDGNGRTARMVELQLLVQAGVPIVAVHLLSNHYNKTRTEYYRQLDYASRSGGDITSFVKYAAEGLVDGLREEIDQVNKQQIDLAWKDYIHEQIFKERSSGNERRFRLVKALTKINKPTKVNELLNVSAVVTKDYAGKTMKSITRDLNTLITLGLVEKTVSGYRAKIEQIHAFLPSRNNH